MTHDETNRTSIHSKLLRHPEFAGIVSQFVATIPIRVQLICKCIANEDLESLRTIIHQMRGSCGSYGFDELTPLLKFLDRALDSETKISPLLPKLNELIDTCQRMTDLPRSN
jgi:HPt (histidine-containing phosphotransfer) domain-containing protein